MNEVNEQMKSKNDRRRDRQRDSHKAYSVELAGVPE